MRNLDFVNVKTAAKIHLTQEQADAFEYALFAQDVDEIIITSGAVTLQVKIKEDNTLEGVGNFDP